MAERAEAARHKRQLRTRIAAGIGGAVALVLVVWLVVGLTTGDDGKPTASAPTPAATAASCTWLPIVDPSASPQPTALPGGRKDVGTPPTSVPNSGYQVMTLKSSKGAIKIEMDLSKAPCTAASFAYLASKKFFDNSGCHRLVPAIFALQCGDPTGTGTGGPSYEFADEYLPAGKLPVYHDGDVAMANGGQNAPNSNGSQFFFLYNNINTELTATYTLFGHVIEGLDIVKAIAAGGDDEAFAADSGGGHPKTKITFTSVTVGAVTTESAAAASPTASSAASATASANANS